MIYTRIEAIASVRTQKLCAKCLEFPRMDGDAMCWACRDIERKVAAAHRRGDPEQKPLYYKEKS